MRTSSTLRRLAEVIGDLEQRSWEVHDLRPRGDGLIEDGATEVNVGVTIPLEQRLAREDVDLEPHEITCTEDGDLRITFRVRLSNDDVTSVSDPDFDATADPEHGAPTPVETDDAATARRSPALESSDTATAQENPDPDEAIAADTASSDPDPDPDADADADSAAPNEPPHRDPDRLREVYDSDATFAEMRDELGVDVTAQTVRKHMVNHGIHEPASYATATSWTEPIAGDRSRSDRPTEGSTDTPDVGDDQANADPVADGVGLPDHLTVDDVVEAVHEHRTMLALTNALDLDRQAARELLTDLDILDLLHGRLATDGPQKPPIEEIESRIREASRD